MFLEVVYLDLMGVFRLEAYVTRTLCFGVLDPPSVVMVTEEQEELPARGWVVIHGTVARSTNYKSVLG